MNLACIAVYITPSKKIGGLLKDLVKSVHDISQEDFEVGLKEAGNVFDLGKALNRPVKYLSLGERVKA